MLFKTFFSDCRYVILLRIIARQSCAMVCRWRFFASCISASHVQHVLDLHPKFALRPHPHTKCGSMVDIQSATAEIRRGKKKKKRPQDENIMSASATQGGYN